MLRLILRPKSFLPQITPFKALQDSQLEVRYTSTLIMANKAAFLESAKGRIYVGDAEIAQPGEGEVLVKVQACAIQPADVKTAKLAIIPLEYPAVLGSPVAGTVEALGPGVCKVKVGDRIVCGTKVFVHKKAKYGGLQRYSIVDESEVVEVFPNRDISHIWRKNCTDSGAIQIGDKITFADVVPLGSYTPPGALFGSLAMHYPSIPTKPLPASEQGKKILIWGGSSAMGSLSISYAKAAGYVVISTSSPHNFVLLKNCGVDHIFDHSDPATVGKIQDLFPIDYWFDTISLKPSLTTIFKILAPEGKPVMKAKVLTLLPLVMTGLKETEIPDGVTTLFHRFSTHAPENAEWNKFFLTRGGFLETAIKGGVLKAVPAEVLGGLEKVDEGIETIHKGVSGKKIVIEPWA